MTWLEKDIADLMELKDEWCRDHKCENCDFNTNMNRPCLAEIATSLGFTLESIKKAQRRFEEYV